MRGVRERLVEGGEVGVADAGGSGAGGRTEDGTPVASAVPFVVVGWDEVRDVLVSKRLLLGWSQSHLAGQTLGEPRMHHNTVYLFEKRGYRGPQDLPVVLRLCEALGLEVRLGVREVPGAAGAPCAANPKRLGPSVGPRRVSVPLSIRTAQRLVVEAAQPRGLAVEVEDPELGF